MLRTGRAYRAQSGFTLMELLVVMCCIVVLMALLAPQVRPVLEKRKQVQAFNEVKAIGDALAQYTLVRDGIMGPGDPVDINDYFGGALPYLDVKTLLVPDFLHHLPEFDPWGQPYEVLILALDFQLTPASMLPAPPPHLFVMGTRVFLVRSSGRNALYDDAGGLYEAGRYALNQGFPPPLYGDDIVYADGSVIRWPGKWEFGP